MDSFYDVPRPAPLPTPVEKFLTVPVVPEVSMICQTKSTAKDFMPYHTWKMQQHPSDDRNILPSKGENAYRGPGNHCASPQNISQLFKKQVRFESPVLQQRQSLTYEPFNRKKNLNKNPLQEVVCQSQFGVEENRSPINGKTFEEIYMANVPTRQLDLSIIEMPKTLKKSLKSSVISEERQQEGQRSNLSTDVHLEFKINKDKENEVPKTYREFLETQKKIVQKNKVDLNDSVTDIFNYKKANRFNSNKTSLENKNFNKHDDQSDVNSKNLSLELKSPHIKNTDYCVQNLKDPILYELQVQKQQQPLYNRTYKGPIHSNNYTENYDYQNHNLYKNDSSKLDTQTQTTIVEVQTPKETIKERPEKDGSELTNKDLLKIIAQQNEQLLVLQKQVAMLLNREQKSQPQPIEAVPQPHRANYAGEKCVTSTQNDNFKNSVQDVIGTPRKRGMSKFSIDLMTSFEVAIRPQHTKQNFGNHEPKIQEITESESIATAVEWDRNDKTVVDTSLHLQEPMNVREVCPSPEPSININMNDYDSSEDDEVTASDIGATFYQNLMGQVNNILKKAQVQTKEDLENREKSKKNIVSDRMKEKTMDRVKEATLKHLKNIGVTIGPKDIDNSSSFGNDIQDYSPTEVSFAVKQILMKYLPDDQLAKITYKQAYPAPFCKEEKPKIIPVRPEFSFASVQYMKKYNLISNNDIKPRDIEVQHPQKLDGPKILDITALKMQPKLL